jgi:predicted metal-dependent TIM-barrel fold hydrolase
MRIFEPHAHMFSRVTDDYERMAMAGIAAVLEPAFWLGQPRTHVGTFLDYFDTLLGWEPYRAAQFGIRHYCALSLNPKEANDDRVNRGVLDALPRYLVKDGVLAVGEIGYDDMTPKEELFFAEQLELARAAGLPALIHTPHRDKKRGVERTLALLRESRFPLERALVDHNNEETVALCIDTGCHMAFSIYPNTKMDEERMVEILRRYGTDRMIVNSACDWGKSDPLKVPRTALLMRQRGFPDDEIDKVVWRNPVAFFAQSGRLDLGDLESGGAAEAPREPFLGNVIQRGQPR